MSNSSIMSVREMIDNAFGETDVNVVNFKLIQAILYLLARQLRILERRVGVEIEISRGHSKTSLSVTEVKIHATVPKKRKRIAKPAGAGNENTEEIKFGKEIITSSESKPSKQVHPTRSAKAIEKSVLEKSITKSLTDKSTSEKTKSSADKTSSDKTKSSTDKTSSDQTKSSTDKTSSDKTKTSADKTSSDQTKYSTATTSSDKTKSSADKTSSDQTKYSTDKTSSDKTKSSTDKTSSDPTKFSTDKAFSDKTSSDKTSSEKTKSSSDRTSSTKTSTDKTSSEIKSSTEKSSTAKSSTEKSSTEKSSTEKSSTEKTSTDKSSTEKSFTEKSSTEKSKSSSKKTSTPKEISSSSGPYKGKDLPNLLDVIEEQREKELRVIHQRADSREVAEKSPTPMASLDSVEEQYEKLLVVERVPAERTRSLTGKRTPQLSIVTQDQFEALANVVRDLQSRFTPLATPDFPDNVQLMQDLRKGASLTDAMAALQLSARLDAAEKTLKQMMELVTDLASKSGLEIELTSQGVPDTMNVLREATGTSTSLPSKSKKSLASKHSKLTTKSEILPSSVDFVHVPIPSSEPSKVEMMPTPTSIPGPEEEKFIVPLNCITYDDLDKALQEVSDGLLKTLTGLTTQSNVYAVNAIRIANRLEEKLDSSLNLGSRMSDLELLVSEFAEEINTLDTGLSSQMTNYQEQLTQMQHDLEAGLEAMAEALINTGGDTAAVAELNAHFTILQTDVEIANTRQNELMESQNGLSQDLQALWKQIEMLRELKSDRDEVADALRDKAGLRDLNGLVSLQQFHAVRGDFEKRIGSAYDKFNNQEVTWQKAIDDLLRELNDKADWGQLVALRADINKNLEMLCGRTQAMLEIVGEPRAATITKKLFRDAACLSCSSPAHMDLEEISTLPKFPAFPGPAPRPPTIGAEDSSKPAEDGDHRVCIPGLPIPHPRDPRSHICHRYCGGSHTLVTDKKRSTPLGMTINIPLRPITTSIGSDGRIYKMEEVVPTKKPCLPCNENKLNTPPTLEAEPVNEEFGSDMTPSDYLSALCSVDEQKDDSATPPPPVEEF